MRPGGCISPFYVIPERFERSTRSLEGCCSIQLSYGTIGAQGPKAPFADANIQKLARFRINLREIIRSAGENQGADGPATRSGRTFRPFSAGVGKGLRPGLPAGHQVQPSGQSCRPGQGTTVRPGPPHGPLHRGTHAGAASSAQDKTKLVRPQRTRGDPDTGARGRKCRGRQRWAVIAQRRRPTPCRL